MPSIVALRPLAIGVGAVGAAGPGAGPLLGGAVGADSGDSPSIVPLCAGFAAEEWLSTAPHEPQNLSLEDVEAPQPGQVLESVPMMPRTLANSRRHWRAARRAHTPSTWVMSYLPGA